MNYIDPNFEKLKLKDKMEYYSRVVSNLHAVIAVALSYVSLSCDDETIFSSDKCLMEPKNVNVYLILMSSAYCVYDLYICFCKIKLTLK